MPPPDWHLWAEFCGTLWPTSPPKSPTHYVAKEHLAIGSCRVAPVRERIYKRKPVVVHHLGFQWVPPNGWRVEGVDPAKMRVEWSVQNVQTPKRFSDPACMGKQPQCNLRSSVASQIAECSRVDAAAEPLAAGWLSWRQGPRGHSYCQRTQANLSDR